MHAGDRTNQQSIAQKPTPYRGWVVFGLLAGWQDMKEV